MTPPLYSNSFTGATRVLYQDLVAAGETDASLDQGFSSVAYSSARRGSVRGSSDRRIEVAELFEKITASSSHAAAYQRFAGEALPWRATGNATSLEVLRRFDAGVSSWRTQNGLASGVNRALAEHIYNWVTSSSGLGLTVVENEAERSLDQVFSSRRGDCTECTKVLLNLLSRVGFQPYPVWVNVDSSGREARHIATALDINGRTYLLDPVFGSFNQAHRSYTRLSLREFLAWHWNNRALDQQSSSPQNALSLMQRALQIDPNNPHLLLNRGFLKRDHLSDPSGARADFQAALTADSAFAPAQFELGNMEFDAGRYREAASFYRQAVTNQPRNASYRRNLVLALGRLGRNQEAQPHFTALCRLETDAPDLPRLARLIGTSMPARTRVSPR